MEQKKSVKITKEQYNRIFASKLLNENFSMEEPMSNNLQPETLELIKFLYRKSEELSPFWADKGLSYDEICEFLLNKGLIIPKEGKYEIPKSLGEPQDAIKLIQDALGEIIGESPEMEEPSLETEVSEPVELEPIQPEMEQDFTEETIVEINGPLSTLASNDEISIVTDGSSIFTFNYADLSMQPLSDEELNDYIALNPKQIGYGLDSWINGRTKLVQIDDDLTQELMIMYDKDPRILSVLSPNEEAVEEIGTEILPTPQVSPLSTGNKVIDKLKQLKHEEEEVVEDMDPIGIEEMTSAGSSATGGSSGPFTAPLTMGSSEDDLIKRSLPPVVSEMTDTSSSGQYDTNALPGISRNGTFKTPKKSKAETKTQWADGGFVEFNDCTKLNNKTSSTGCSGGAVDNVVKVKKSNGNINAPSLNEMRILIAVSQKTGKTIKEIKTIIESKS